MDNVQITETDDPGDASSTGCAAPPVDFNILPSSHCIDTTQDAMSCNSDIMKVGNVALCDTYDQPVIDAVVDNADGALCSRCIYPESEEGSDTASWDSETPLLCKSKWGEQTHSIGGETWKNKYLTEENPIIADCDKTDNIDLVATTGRDINDVNIDFTCEIGDHDSANKLGNTTEIQDVNTSAHEPGQTTLIGSITSLLKPTCTIDPQEVYLSEVEVEDISYTPLQIIGSGWEFGSLSSINRHSREGFRSRVNTIDNSLKNRFNDNRLLTRIFANVVGSNEIVKSKTELNTSIIDLGNKVEAECKLTNEHGTNLKNIVVISVGLALMFAAIGGLRNLQSSINAKGGVGVFSLAIIYATFMIGSLVSPFIVQRFKPKLCLIAACMCSSLYVVSNYVPTFAVIIPASAIMGAALAVIWNALSTYITEISMHEAELKNKNTDVVTSRYFGIFFLALQFSNVVGNLVSSVILRSDNRLYTINRTGFVHIESSGSNSNADYTQSFSNISDPVNPITIDINSAHTSPICGTIYCLDDETTTSAVVDDLDKIFLLGTYTTCVIVAGIVIHFFLDELPNYVSSSAELGEVVRQARSVMAMCVDKQFVLIVMLCAYSMVGNGFVIADVMKAFVTCPTGIHMVGYTMICFGLCGAASSFMAGKMVKCVGRVPIIVTAAATNIVMLAWMVTWHPEADDTYLLFVLLGGWGFADGIWQSQLNSLISAVFPDRYEEAFGCCRFIQGLTGVVLFGVSSSLCMMSKVVVTASTCVVALVLYLVLEIFVKTRPITNVEIRVD